MLPKLDITNYMSLIRAAGRDKDVNPQGCNLLFAYLICYLVSVCSLDSGLREKCVDCVRWLAPFLNLLVICDAICETNIFNGTAVSQGRSTLQSFI